MNKYRVAVEGKNFFVRFEDEPRKVGFFATRLIEAGNKDEAEKITLGLLRKELAGIVLNDPTDSPMLYIDEVTEVETFGEHIVPGKGFTFYVENRKKVSRRRRE